MRGTQEELFLAGKRLFDIKVQDDWDIRLVDVEGDKVTVEVGTYFSLTPRGANDNDNLYYVIIEMIPPWENETDICVRLG